MPSGRSFLTPVFLACAATLTLAAIGLQPALGWLVAEYSKLPIDVLRPLDQFDAGRISSFRPAPEPAFFTMELDATVGTDEAMRLVFEEPERGGRREFDTLLFVTYYSDPRDRVPHTPEVCYRQGGATVTDMRHIPLEVPALGEDSPIDVLMLDMERNDWRQVLLYVFYSGGRFYDSRLGVRWAMGIPGDRYVYFSKIEVMTSVPPGTEVREAVDRCRRLLSEAIPVLVEDHFPTRDDVARR